MVLSENPISDLSPLADMKLTSLGISGGPVTELPQLKDLKALTLSNFPISDLSMFKGNSQWSLRIHGDEMTDLPPLEGLDITMLRLDGSAITDISPLRGAKIQALKFAPWQITNGMDVIRSMPTLKKFGMTSSEFHTMSATKFWKFPRPRRGDFV